ncbi:hypothetical protein ACLB2K_063208 [Fragaria x ananassa]
MYRYFWFSLNSWLVSTPSRLSGITKQGKTSAVAGGTYYAGEVQALTKEITDLKLSVDLLEKERDFYFGKLRDIEILCQTSELESVPMSVAIKKILYAADAKESALTKAQEYLVSVGSAEDAEAEEETQVETQAALHVPNELHLLILLWRKPERPRRKPGKPMRKPEKPRKRTYKSWHVFNNVSSFSSPNSAYASQQSHPRSSPMMMIMMMEALIQ